ncbi:MAG: peptidoglycan DD-metalloendopeptidase family protein [Bacteroidota bacterium]
MKLKLYPYFLIVILVLTGTAAYSQTKDKLQKDKKQLEKDIQYTNKLLNETKKSKQISLSQLMILNNQITMREDLISSISNEIDGLDIQIFKNNQTVRYLDKELKKLKTEYAKMIFYAFRNRNRVNNLMFILASSNINQAYRRMRYLQQYAEYRKRQAFLIINTQKLLSGQITQLEYRKNNKTSLLHEKESEKTNLSVEKEEKNLALKSLRAKEKELMKTLKEKQNAASKLNKAIETIIANEIKKSKSKNNSNKNVTTNKTNVTTNKKVTTSVYDLTPAEQTLSNSFESNMGKLPWPSEKGVVTSTFGKHPHPVLDGITVNNNGIDIGTNRGATCRAIFEGKVTGVVSLPGSGKAVIVRHGDYLTVYSNLSEVFVKMNDAVKTKQTLGVIITDDSDSKTELHFEVWKGKALLNPMSWLSKK